MSSPRIDLYERLRQRVDPGRDQPDPRPQPGTRITATIESTDEERNGALLGDLGL